MTTLSEYYASAPTDELKINTLVIDAREAGKGFLRLCDGFEDQNLGVEGVLVPFEACSLSVSLPARNTSGQQELAFSVGGANHIAQEYIDAATETDALITMRFREYFISDKMNPVSEIEMVLVGGAFEGDMCQFTGSFQDLLNLRWPRQLYTINNAPGLQYFT